MKRITTPVQGNIDSIKKELQEKLGISMSYSQVVDYLIKHYRSSVQPTTMWRGK